MTSAGQTTEESPAQIYPIGASHGVPVGQRHEHIAAGMRVKSESVTDYTP
jgi:hypothetical protein